MAATALLAAAATPASASASTIGALTQLAAPQDCIGQGSTGCGASGSGLAGAQAAVVSPDGRNVYVASFSGQAVAEFSRDPASGALTQLSGANACVGSMASGCTSATGLAEPEALAISPDGSTLYVVSSASGGSGPAGEIAEFSRNGTTGALTQLAAPNDCIAQSGATSCGNNAGHGLKNAYDVTVSPDGLNVYVAAGGDGTDPGDVAEFSRDTATGALTQLASPNDCLEEHGGGSDCGTSTGKGLLAANRVVVSPDGADVYVAEDNAPGAIAELRRNSDGSLSQLPSPDECLGETGNGDCEQTGHGLSDIYGLAASPDGRNLYSASLAAHGPIAELQRSSSGALTQLPSPDDCLASSGDGECGTTAHPLASAYGLAVSPDGASVYVASDQDGAVLELGRAFSGALSQLPAPSDCVQTATASGCGTSGATGISTPLGLAVSPDSRSLYVAGGTSSSGALAAFSRVRDPNGAIAFASSRDGDQEIYSAGPNGTGLTRLTNSPGLDGQPSFSGDGTKLAFSSDRQSATFDREIYVMGADGSNPVDVTNNDAFDADPAFSPDGSKIAFISNRDGTNALWIMNSDGSNPHLAFGSGDSGCWSGFPRWSPDGTKIAFQQEYQCQGNSSDHDILVVAADGSGSPLDITASDRSDDTMPTWSPDSRQIAYTRTDGTGASSIWTAAADGSVTPAQVIASGSAPAWSPDGTQLAYLTSAGNIARAALYGGGTPVVVDGSGSDSAPAWQNLPAPAVAPPPPAPPQLITVPVDPAQPNGTAGAVPHQGFSGSPLTLEAIVRGISGSGWSYHWDDSAINYHGSTTTVSTPYNLGATMILSGPTGLTHFTLTLTGPGGVTVTADYPVYINATIGPWDTATPDQLAAARSMAIDRALWFEHAALQRALTGGGLPVSYTGATWGEAQPEAEVLKLLERTGHLPAYPPGSYNAMGSGTSVPAGNDARWNADPYAEDALGLTDRLLSQTSAVSVPATAEQRDGQTAIAGTNDGIGYSLLQNGAPNGSVADALGALAASGLSSTVVQPSEDLGYAHPLAFVEQQMVDFLASAQLTSGGATAYSPFGAWSYSRAQSTPVLGLDVGAGIFSALQALAADPAGVIVSQATLSGIATSLRDLTDSASGLPFGEGTMYTSLADDGVVMQGAHLIGWDGAGAAASDAALLSGYLDALGRYWSTPPPGNGFGHQLFLDENSGYHGPADIYSVYNTARGLESLANSAALAAVDGHDWYREFTVSLLAMQTADGSWPPPPDQGDSTIAYTVLPAEQAATAWAAMTLVPVAGTSTVGAPPEALTVTRAGSGVGTVTSSPAGISCGSACAGAFDHGATVTLTATPEPDTIFTGWSGGGCSGTGTCQLPLSSAQAVTATFTALPPGNPTATTGPATNITTAAATLTGTVNPNGQQTRYYFQYGTGTDYASPATATVTLSGDSSDHAVSADLNGLPSDTLYHYRLVALSGGVERDGADATFRTAMRPPTVNQPQSGAGPQAQTATAATYRLLVSGESGATLSVADGGSVILTATLSGGSLDSTLTLPLGTHTLTFTQTLDGRTSPATTVTLDVTAPPNSGQPPVIATPQITSGLSGGRSVTVTVAVSSPDGSPLTVNLGYGQSSTTEHFAPGYASGAGKWTFNVSGLQPDQKYKLQVFAHNATASAQSAAIPFDSAAPPELYVTQQLQAGGALALQLSVNPHGAPVTLTGTWSGASSSGSFPAQTISTAQTVTETLQNVPALMPYTLKFTALSDQGSTTASTVAAIAEQGSSAFYGRALTPGNSESETLSANVTPTSAQLTGGYEVLAQYSGYGRTPQPVDPTVYYPHARMSFLTGAATRLLTGGQTTYLGEDLYVAGFDFAHFHETWTIGDLQPATTYSFQASYADGNWEDDSSGRTASFTTSSVSAPSSGVISGNSASLVLACATAATCRGTLALAAPLSHKPKAKSTKGPRTVARPKAPKLPAAQMTLLGRTSFQLPGRRSAAIHVRLNAAGRRLLGRRRTLRVTETASVRVRGRAVQTVRTITLRR